MYQHSSYNPARCGLAWEKPEGSRGSLLSCSGGTEVVVTLSMDTSASPRLCFSQFLWLSFGGFGLFVCFDFSFYYCCCFVGIFGAFCCHFFEAPDGFCSGSSDSCPSSLGSPSTPAFAENDPKTELRNELCQVPPL